MWTVNTMFGENLYREKTGVGIGQKYALLVACQENWMRFNFFCFKWSWERQWKGQIYPPPPSVVYRHPPNLRQILVHSALKKLPFRECSDREEREGHPRLLQSQPPIQRQELRNLKKTFSMIVSLCVFSLVKSKDYAWSVTCYVPKIY